MENYNNGKGQAKVLTIVMIILFLCAFLFAIYTTVKVAEAMAEACAETETNLETEQGLSATETETKFTEETELGLNATEIGLGVYTEENNLYILCEVTETTPETFTVKLPNGNLETFYMIQDPPIDDEGNPWFERVCFKVEKGNESNFDAWEVIACN